MLAQPPHFGNQVVFHYLSLLVIILVAKINFFAAFFQVIFYAKEKNKSSSGPRRYLGDFSHGFSDIGYRAGAPQFVSEQVMFAIKISRFHFHHQKSFPRAARGPVFGKLDLAQ